MRSAVAGTDRLTLRLISDAVALAFSFNVSNILASVASKRLPSNFFVHCMI
jgi:hypothetical protein